MRRLTWIGFVSVFCVAFFCFPSDAVAQTGEEADVDDFTFVVEAAGDQISLSRVKGCAWTNLSFSARGAQAVDQHGMTTLPRKQERIEQDSELANFVFTIERTQDGVRLEGKEGSAWKRLSFSCRAGSCNQAVDQNGMTILSDG